MKKAPCRCVVLEVDGFRAIVRTAGGRSLTARDLEALRELARAAHRKAEEPRGEAPNEVQAVR